MEDSKLEEIIKNYLKNNLKIKIEANYDIEGGESVQIVNVSLHLDGYDSEPITSYETTVYKG